MRQITATLCSTLLAASASAGAAAADLPGDPPDDTDALTVADQPATAPRSTQNWRLFGEASVGRDSLRSASSSVTEARLSLDLRYDGNITPGLRAVLSDRLDLTRRDSEPRKTHVNTLREAYLSWQPRPDVIADLGRVNLRYGAALGYNPTDYFKAGALRSIISPDPASLRENRQGTVVVQGQKLWSANSLTAAFSPRLSSTTSSSTFALDFGATNPHDRWLLAGSHRFSEQFNPQLLLHGGAGMSPQGGFNLSGLVNSATVAFVEFSAGKGRSLTAQALGTAEPEHTQRRAAVGLTYTTDFNLSLTAELDHNSAAPNRGQWRAFSAGAPENALRLLGATQAQQDLAVRQSWFFYAAWRDMWIKNLDLSAFVRHDPMSHSRAQWLETRYHWSKAEVALQWQGYSGDPRSLYGSVPQARRIDLLLRLFL